MARFQIEIGGRKLASDAERVDVGTRSTCWATIDDPIASERHAWIEWSAGEFRVSDAGSASGTWRSGGAGRKSGSRSARP